MGGLANQENSPKTTSPRPFDCLLPISSRDCSEETPSCEKHHPLSAGATCGGFAARTPCFPCFILET